MYGLVAVCVACMAFGVVMAYKNDRDNREE